MLNAYLVGATTCSSTCIMTRYFAMYGRGWGNCPEAFC